MKKYTQKEALEHIKKMVKVDNLHHDKDNDCQIIIYTGLYEWQDGTFRDQPE